MSWRSLFGRRARTAAEPKVPEGQRIYVVGDIHGRADLIRQLRMLIASDQEAQRDGEPVTVFLGDYVDRGMDSKAVVDLLATEPFPTPLVALRGNHETMLLAFLDRHEAGPLWIQNGGLETLHSYGVDVSAVRLGRGFDAAAAHLRAALPPAHLMFFQSLRLSFVAGDYFFCHAGIRPGVRLDQQQEEDLLWIREVFLTSSRQHEKIIVHGHTPVQEPEIAPNRINVDTGAYISGRLTCLVLEGTTRRFLVADTSGARGATDPAPR